jgi:RNA polymerase subunit RPABC4/transcription elongation factor Spt4
MELSLQPMLASVIEYATTDSIGTLKIAVIAYFGLLWMAIIIWVTKDSLERSNSIIFQAISILLNIAIPFLGILLYLIIRPSKTRMENYYEELERNMLETGETGETNVCDKCLTPVDKSYNFCPNCAESLKKTCSKCKKNFPSIWNICPFCGKEYTSTVRKSKKSTK